MIWGGLVGYGVMKVGYKMLLQYWGGGRSSLGNKERVEEKKWVGERGEVPEVLGGYGRRMGRGDEKNYGKNIIGVTGGKDFRGKKSTLFL